MKWVLGSALDTVDGIYVYLVGVGPRFEVHNSLLHLLL
jgi:hypothetical protein